ncbi:MAG: hypothetical protein RL238_2060 [Actinomycetota bacterium]|jgi:hypothetical protein
MSKQKLTRTALGVAAAGLGLFALVVGVADAKGGGGGGGGGGGDAKQGSYVLGNCTDGATGFFGYNKSGDRVTYMVGASADSTGAAWTVTVSDDLAGTVYSGPNGSIGTDWSILGNFTAPKGNNTLSVTMVSDNGVDSCSASLAFKV